MKEILQAFCLVCVIGVFLSPAYAGVSLNSIFGDHMVLQQQIPVPVWGTADSGEKISVTFAGQTVDTVADASGKWKVRLEPLHASGEPKILKIQGHNTLEIKDVLVGEVWVCSGQSNMERQLGLRPPQNPIVNWEKERDAADHPGIRQFRVVENRKMEPQSEVQGRWVICSPGTVSDFSAVGYFFARDLHQALKVPVGILFAAAGGSRAELWTGRAALENDPVLMARTKAFDKARAEYPAELAEFEKNELSLKADWQKAAEADRVRGERIPPEPKGPVDPAFSNEATSVLFNGMIIPLMPYGIRGIAWYQGESNSKDADQYAKLFKLMIEDWRTQWSLGKVPFLFVQIAPFKGMAPEIREAQLETLRTTENTAMIVTVDCGDPQNIHPANKEPVGHRLALAAESLAYHETIEYSGPLIKSIKIDGDSAVLSFAHASQGLVAQGGELRGFDVSSDGKKFTPASAKIDGDTVVVHASAISHPRIVRYGWSNVPDGNLFNGAGLPASPFRTDTF